MPVHAVEGGFRWGTSGKIYRSRAQAERQARAIYAYGYREDARSLPSVRRALKVSPRAEARYVRDLTGILRGVHEWTMAQLEPEIARWQPDSPKRTDGRPNAHHVVSTVLAGLKTHVARHVSDAFDRMAVQVNRRNIAGMQLLGINVSPSAHDVLKRARDENIRLVEDAGRSYAQQVREIFDDDANFGLRPEELKAKLLERADVSESRAQLIARDQTLKTNAALTKDRQQKAGITRYRWSGSLDERERPMHRELEGQMFDWDAPPVTNPQGDTNHPGEDFQCRCVAAFVPADLEDDEAGEA
jgi:SPP1 gp7 family putative phage head morphogenesis protein